MTFCNEQVIHEQRNINEFGLKTGRRDRFIKTVKIDSSFTID